MRQKTDGQADDNHMLNFPKLQEWTPRPLEAPSPLVLTEQYRCTFGRAIVEVCAVSRVCVTNHALEGEMGL